MRPGAVPPKVSKSPSPLRVFLTCMFDSVLQGSPART